MAYTATQLRLVLTKAGDIIQKNETRRQMTGIVDVAMRNQAAMVSAAELAKIKKANGQPTKIYVLGKNTNATTTTRECGPFTGNGGSRAIDVTFSIVSAGFSISHNEIEENEYSYDEVFTHEMSEALRRIDEQLDANGYTFLNAQKTSGTASIYTPAAGIINIPKADYNVDGNNPVPKFLANLTSQLAVDKYSGTKDFIGDPITMSILQTLLAQGQGNAGNTGYQFLDWNSNFSNNIPKDAGDYAEAFVMPAGYFTMVTWAKDYSKRKNLGTDMWFNMAHPYRPGVMLEVKYKGSCDAGNGGNDELDSWNISLAHAYVAAGVGLADTGIRRLDFQTT